MLNLSASTAQGLVADLFADLALEGVTELWHRVRGDLLDELEVPKGRNYLWNQGYETDKIYLGTGDVGNFRGLKNASIPEILSRIPAEATRRELIPVDGGATAGFEYKWNQNGQTYRIRIHNVDPSAPPGSNASQSWIVRIMRGKQYYDCILEDFQPAKFVNPRGDFFNEAIMNNTHIPIESPGLY